MDQVIEQAGFVPEDEQNAVAIPAGSPELLPERRFIPEPAREEAIKLFNGYLAEAKKTDTSREAFVAFLQSVRRQLDIKDNEIWNVSDEATYFERAGPVGTSDFVAVPETQVQGDVNAPVGI